MSGLALWPVAAADTAGKTDLIMVLLLVISGLIMLLVAGLLVGFSVRYRQGSKAQRGPLPALVKKEVEVGWTAATLFLAVFLFAWAGATELGVVKSRPDAIEIHVLAKQWMWKTQHANGAREINALHLPRGTPVRLLMTAQDVIHSFYVPAFRLKQDVLPGRITELGFTPTATGEYHLFCAEYCGTLHARMTGTVVVMEPEDFARWLAAQPEADDLAREGRELFTALGCAGCHAPSAAVHAPDLAGLYGRPVHLADGRTVTADEAYLRDSILMPARDIVAGFQPLMPSFAGLIGEDELMRLIAYIRSLDQEARP